jgi:short-subunit dehydrogenase
MQKYILVTGGTKGIGRAIIEKFATEGFHIITCARGEKDLQNLKVDIEQKHTFSKVHYFAADLGIENERNAFLEFVNKLHLKIEVLVNNTGIFIPGKIIDEPDDVLPAMMATNLYSAYYLTKGLLPEMIKRKQAYALIQTEALTALPNSQCTA